MHQWVITGVLNATIALHSGDIGDFSDSRN